MRCHRRQLVERLAVTAGMWFALVLCLAPAATAAAGDSGRVVHHVRIGPTGIQVERRARGDSAPVVEIVPDRGGRDVAEQEQEGDEGERRGAVSVTGGHGGSIVVNADDDALVRVFADARVAAGEIVLSDVVAIFGSADIAGTVKGDVVAVGGSVRLHPGARVEGDAVAIGGSLDQPAGAEVSGQSIVIGNMRPGRHLPITVIMLVIVLGGWVFTLLLTWVLALLFRANMLRIGRTASTRSAASIFLGIVAAPFALVVTACVVLLAALVNVFAGLGVLFLCILLFWIGQVAGSYLLGCKLLRRTPGEGGLFGPVFMGALLVGLLLLGGVLLSVPEGAARSLSLFFAALGTLLVAGLSVLGTGAMLLSLMGTRPAVPPSAGATSSPQA